MKVFVYFNLHKKVWSVKALEGPQKGLVIAHKRFLVLTNAKPKVSEKGRQRVLQERRKNVHAGIVGEWSTDPSDWPETSMDCWDLVYNPYKYQTFMKKRDHWLGHDTESELSPWGGSKMVVMNADSRGVIAFD